MKIVWCSRFLGLFLGRWLLPLMFLFWGMVASAQEAPIIIGRSASLTGPGSSFGIPVSAGARAWFQHVNAQGGIQGRSIELVEIDDGYDMQRMLENTRRLLEEYKAQALFLYVGTPLVMRAMEVVEKEKVPLVAPISWADALRDEYRRHLFPMRSNVSAEARVAIEHLKLLQVRRLIALYQDDGIGKAASAALEQAAKRSGTIEISLHPIKAEKLDSAWIETLQAQKPDAIVLAGYEGSVLHIVKTFRSKTMALPIIVMSTVNDSDLATLGERAAGVMNTQPFPHPQRSNLAVAMEFRQLMEKYQPKAHKNYAAMEGFLAARVLTEALKKCGKEVSSACITRALESMQSYDFGGYSVRYGQNSHLGSSFVELLVLDRRGQLIR